jgi:restriction system protein
VRPYGRPSFGRLIRRCRFRLRPSPLAAHGGGWGYRSSYSRLPSPAEWYAIREGEAAVQDGSIGWSLARMVLAAYGQPIVAAWPVFVGFAALLGSALAAVVNQERRFARSGIATMHRMDGRAFERRLAQLFTRLGYRVEETPYSGDCGADLIIGIGGKRIAVQAKRSRHPIGVKAVQEVVAAKDFYRCTDSMVVTNRMYTAQARTLAQATGTELWDRPRLIVTLLATGGTGETAGDTSPSLLAGQPDLCRICGKVLSPKVLAFCLDHPERFGGRAYCFEHQRSVRSSDPFAML